MAKKDRTVEIYVKPDTQSPNGYTFWMEYSGARTNKLTFDKNDDKMHKKDEYRIFFNLTNTGGADLRFSKSLRMVLWAKEVAHEDDACPDDKCYLPDVFFVDPEVTIKDKKLTVVNMDMDCLLFKFAMNFVADGKREGPTTNYICFDPIGENRNGGRTSSLLLAALVLAVAAASVAAIGFFAFRERK